MLQRLLICVCMLMSVIEMNSQEASLLFRTKKLAVKDSIHVDSVSINPFQFKVYSKTKKVLDSSNYQMDFESSVLILTKELTKAQDTLIIEYYRYPEFLTKSYFEFDPDLIVESNENLDKLYSLSKPNTKKKVTPFDGLVTNGSISRGVTVGSNQNTVLNSELDLQIVGKLSENVSLRASIQDANVPVQQNGYSQNLDEFDQIFIELYSKNWKVRAGDVPLQNTESYFNKFTKNVQGISLQANIEGATSTTEVFASGALVRGIFTRSQFIGQEGNQGPYKLTGPNGELFILIVSGSERVYVNGVLLERGENKDYIIDYNAGEVRFNPTFPISSEMRIAIEYQSTERNYSRIFAYGGGTYETEKFSIGASVYSENDAKNQPLQQNLSDEQKQILSEAGDNTDLMFAPSAIPDTFDENKILYRKELIEDREVFIFSNDPEEELFNVRFSQVGVNQGDYVLSSVNTITRIYEYVSPINGIPQGDYAPVVRLDAPNKLQIATIEGSYFPSDKTRIDFELAGSQNDLNLFSNLDDSDNDGFAGHLEIKKQLFKRDSGWTANFVSNLDYIQDEFSTVERIYNIEFNRDWNLTDPLGNQQLYSTGIQLVHPEKGFFNYNFQHLNFSENYNGNRHNFSGRLLLKDWVFNTYGSFLNNQNGVLDGRFFRMQTHIIKGFGRKWIGAKFATEENKEIDVENLPSYTNNTQRFKSYEIFTGIGDSTAVYGQIGYNIRTNDSVRNNLLEHVNTSHTYYLQSKLINTKKTQLSVFGNYRFLRSEEENTENEKSLNSRVLYNQRFAKNFITSNTVYETNSGTLPQQEFTYVEVEPGQGTYTWNDYNNNNIQELEEFEIAQFTDQANYLRILLPNQIFIKTHQNKFSQTLILNPLPWSTSKKSFQKIISHFYNQTSFLIDRKSLRSSDRVELNPFDSSDNELGLNLNFRNTFFYNRGKQKYTTSYTYIDTKNKNLLVTGLQENNSTAHQLHFIHKFFDVWLLELQNELNTLESIAENFENRNYLLEGYIIEPKISYLLSKQTQFSIFYSTRFQENILDIETLNQQKLGASFAYADKKQFSVLGEFNYFENDFSGNPFSPVGYQLLNGLQPGSNFTWSLIAQKRITKFLDLNLNYLGRKSESSQTIHTGSIQLRAFF